MASRIECITKPDPHSPLEHIEYVGGYRNYGQGPWFYITREECASDIDNNREQYYVLVGSDLVYVETYSRTVLGPRFIKTKPDRTTRDNLLSLVQCSTKLRVA